MNERDLRVPDFSRATPRHPSPEYQWNGDAFQTIIANAGFAIGRLDEDGIILSPEQMDAHEAKLERIAARSAQKRV